MAWGRQSSTWHPPDWPRTRTLVRRRDGGRCQWPSEAGTCGSTDRVQVDRRVPWAQGGGSGTDNAWCLCHTHHAEKTASEAAAARRARSHRTEPAHPSRARR